MLGKICKSLLNNTIPMLSYMLGNARLNAFFPSNSGITEGQGYVSLLKRMLVHALLHKPEMFGLTKDIVTPTFIVNFLKTYGNGMLNADLSYQNRNTMNSCLKLYLEFII